MARWYSVGCRISLPLFHPGKSPTFQDEAKEPEHVIEAVTGHLSRRMLEHYSRQRLKARGQMLARMEERPKKKTAWIYPAALIRTSNALSSVSHPRISQCFAWRPTTLVECVHEGHWISSSQ
jgi:hypothetical protein